MILLSHPIGNANVRHAAQALADARLLEEYWTCVSWDPRSRWNRVLPAGLRQQLARRALPDRLRPYAHHVPWREAGRMLAARLGWDFPCRHERGPCSIDAVFQSLDRRVARRLARVRGVKAVYAYEDGAARTFAVARELGIHRVYELPIGYWRAAHAIFREECEREPEWTPTLGGLADSEAKLERKDDELRMASTIVVPSTFVRETLKLAPGVSAPIHVIPYGGPVPTVGRLDGRTVGQSDGRTVGRSDSRTVRPSDRQTVRLRVLFVGSLGQRKGLAYLLKAIAGMRAGVTLTLIGRKTSETCGPLNEAVKRHRWVPSAPHAGVLREMSEHDVLVFPSLLEGFGLVILEAMSQGLPVITTNNSGGLDIVTDGVDGFIVPIRSAGAITEKLELLAADRSRLDTMRESAIATARRCSWDRYERRLVEVVTGAVGRSDGRTV